MNPFFVLLATLVFVTVSFGNQIRAATVETRAAPYPTGSHLQMVRKFFTSADGLPADEIRAVTVTRDGMALVAMSNGVFRLEGERWVNQSGPTEVRALFAPRQGPAALAGGTNGVWALKDSRWQLEERSPEAVIAFTAEPGRAEWALAPSGVWRRQNGWTLINKIEDDVLSQPVSMLARSSNDVLVAADTGLFGLVGKRKYWLRLEVRPGGLLSSRTQAVAPLGDGHFLVATDKGLNLSNGARGWESFTGADGLPILDVKHIAVGADGVVWLGSDHGLIRWWQGQWAYFESKRWLPDNAVTAIAPGADGSEWVGTPKGLSHIYQRKLMLTEKAQILQRDLESRDRRHGYVTEMELRAPGVFEGALQEVSDNDGLWTALYVAAQSFRFAASKEPEARLQAWKSMQAVLRLESITGIPGFPARAICHTNEPQFQARSLRSDSEWHPSPVEKDWYWKGETSSDEIDGHYFGWFIFYELAADEEQKKKVRDTCKRVTDHILDHRYYLVDK